MLFLIYMLIAGGYAVQSTKDLNDINMKHIVRALVWPMMVGGLLANAVKASDVEDTENV